MFILQKYLFKTTEQKIQMRKNPGFNRAVFHESFLRSLSTDSCLDWRMSQSLRSVQFCKWKKNSMLSFEKLSWTLLDKNVTWVNSPSSQRDRGNSPCASDQVPEALHLEDAEPVAQTDGKVHLKLSQCLETAEDDDHSGIKRKHWCEFCCFVWLEIRFVGLYDLR